MGSAPASTWDEFLTLCGKFKAMGITPYFGGGQPDVVVEALIGSHFKTAGLSDAAIFDGKATFAEYWGPRSPCTTSCTRPGWSRRAWWA